MRLKQFISYNLVTATIDCFPNYNGHYTFNNLLQSVVYLKKIVIRVLS